MGKNSIQIPDGLKPQSDIIKIANEFITIFVTFENKNKMPQLLLFDKKVKLIICYVILIQKYYQKQQT